MSRVVVVEGEARSIVRFRGPLLQAARDAGHDVQVFGPSDEATRAWLATEGIRFHEMAAHRGAISPFSEPGSLWTRLSMAAASSSPAREYKR